ncbi:MAG TPA: hypothetical protein VGC27_03560 [Rhizomicrobium sp.]
MFDERDVSTSAYHTCNRQAMDRAVAKVNSPLLAQRYGVPSLNANDALGRGANND